MSKIHLWCDPIRSKVIKSLLPPEDEEIYYSLADVFNVLPDKIEYNGKVGYLRISKFDIVYSSLETELEGSVVMMWQWITDDRDIYDAFIEALQWFKEHKNDVKIL